MRILPFLLLKHLVSMHLDPGILLQLAVCICLTSVMNHTSHFFQQCCSWTCIHSHHLFLGFHSSVFQNWYQTLSSVHLMFVVRLVENWAFNLIIAGSSPLMSYRSVYYIELHEPLNGSRIGIRHVLEILCNENWFDNFCWKTWRMS